MKLAFRGPLSVFVVGVFVTAGCSSPPPSTPGANQKTEGGKDLATKGGAENKTKVVVIKAADLPKLGSALPALDGGRIVIRGPDKWLAQSRSTKYLAKYQLHDNKPYPQVIVTVEPAKGITELTDDNQLEFIKEVQERLEREMTEGPVKIIEDVRPIRLEHYPAVDYVRKAKTNRMLLERVMILLVVAGREYTVELRGDAATTKEYEPYAQAVASGLEFHQSDTPPPSTTPTEEPTELQ